MRGCWGFCLFYKRRWSCQSGFVPLDCLSAVLIVLFVVQDCFLGGGLVFWWWCVWGVGYGLGLLVPDCIALCIAFCCLQINSAIWLYEPIWSLSFSLELTNAYDYVRSLPHTRVPPHPVSLSLSTCLSISHSFSVRL